MTQITGTDGHGQACHLCDEPMDSLHGNAGLWPSGFFTASDPGRLKRAHMHCISARLDAYPELVEALDNLHMQGVEGPTSAWMMVPKVEWDSIFKILPALSSLPKET